MVSEPILARLLGLLGRYRATLKYIVTRSSWGVSVWGGCWRSHID